jgi:hypothetical protein
MDHELAAKTNEILSFSSQSGDLTNLKTELGNLQAEVLGLKSILDSKQELINDLEVNIYFLFFLPPTPSPCCLISVRMNAKKDLLRMKSSKKRS